MDRSGYIQEVGGNTNMNRKNTVLAAALALGLLALPVAAQRGMRGGMGHGFGPGFGPERMLERAAIVLDLTEAQKAEAEKLIAGARKEAEPVVAQLKQGREEMHAAVKANNTGNINNIATRQGNLMGQLSAIHAKAMASFYAQLTPEQKAKADKLHDRVRDRFQGMRKQGRRQAPAQQQQ
jgi:Spy/CpxP family protein refolding chaperone